ncbi:hypothetical protein [Micromonospora auratinigra]|uniref:Uncharacterized protein n=1 Tax=Micromonospora auratinigra TaxID=261654 RepID=A0A1A9AA85_9ACTN|nr:hypothetical protein [Micromonospora auratinigra]SBT53109.1 hypothetical protein GA0070611_5957 [Micromonospora auratinigra]
MRPGAETDPNLSAELARHDWTAYRTFTGDGSKLPAAILALAAAESDEQALAGYWRLDNVLAVDGRLSEAAVPVTSCLLVAMDLAPPPGRKSILDLLNVIASGYEEHIDNEVVGRASVRTCVEMMAARRDVFVEELFASGNASCVDILLMCAVHVEGVLGDVERAFDVALSLPSCLSIREHIEIARDDLPGRA